MADLRTSYLGFALRSPVVASSSPICENLDSLKVLEDSGVGAVVLHSLFEEQIEQSWRELDSDLFRGAESYAESLNYLPDLGDYTLGPDKYLEHLRLAKASLGVPVIASLNGCSRGGWVTFAKQIEEAGADALELNLFFVPTDVRQTSEEVEDLYLGIAAEITNLVKIPVVVKLSQFFTSIPFLVQKLENVGVKGVVLFNRFYQPDIDIEKLEVVSNLQLSNASELRLRLRWVAMLYEKVKLDMAITGGVHSASDVLKSMMAGAKVAMSTSALLEKGPQYVNVLNKEIARWMDEHEYVSITQMQGSMSQARVSNPSVFVRANYVRMLRTYSKRYQDAMVALSEKGGSI